MQMMSDQSTLGILDDAPRGQTGTITYDKKSISVLTGSSSASVSVAESNALNDWRWFGSP